MKEKLRDMLKRVRKFSEYLIGILEGENRDNWEDTISEIKDLSKNLERSQVDFQINKHNSKKSWVEAKHIMEIHKYLKLNGNIV